MSAFDAARIIPFSCRAGSSQHAAAAFASLPARNFAGAASGVAGADGTPVMPATDARLMKALAKLNAALDTQRGAMAAWTSALGDLHGATRRLGDSLGEYRGQLGLLASRLRGFRAEAAKLEQWADGVIAREG